MSAENLIDFENSFVEEIVSTNGDAVIKKLKCNLCDFKNTDKGGMKRHILRMHRGTKRNNDITTDDTADKRPKVDPFEPTLASTQIEDDDLEKDEFEEVLMAEENDYECGDVTVAGYSEEMLAKLGDWTQYEFKEVGGNSETKGHSEANNAANEADLKIAKGRLEAWKNESKKKDLAIAEQSLEINNLKGELAIVKEDISRKDDALETNLANMNRLEDQVDVEKSKARSLEEKAAKGTKRIQLLERALKKYMSKANGDEVETAPNDNDPVKLKAIIHAKNMEIKNLKEGKVFLVNELKEAQEKVHESGNDTVDKCIKLTNDLKAKTNQLKVAEKNLKDSKDSQAKIQLAMNDVNNKIAHVETENVKLNDFNNKMYEICKKSGVFEKLEGLNMKEL